MNAFAFFSVLFAREFCVSLVQDELRDATLLVFANKQDLPNAMTVSEITDKLGLHSLRQRRWYFLPKQSAPAYLKLYCWH